MEVTTTVDSFGENNQINEENEEIMADRKVEDIPTADNQDVENETHNDKVSIGFKKPVLLIGPKRGKVSKLKVINDVKKEEQAPNTDDDAPKMDDEKEQVISNSDKSKETESTTEPTVTDYQKNVPLSYTEPSWGGFPEKEYKLEVLKSGMIIDTIDLSKKSFNVVGRLPTCDISLAHLTISRYHAIFQYRSVGSEKNPAGLYLYDLGSINGTFWNGNRVKPNIYIRVRGGHMIRFGCSQRKFIVQAPEDDQEEESELTVTELKQKRMLELAEREKERLLQEEEEIRLKKEKEEEENLGIDWGMGEDADEETDLTENPYATTGDEELFLNDPKKTLRGWFEREGYELQYQTEEKGIGQFLCWVNLPVENFTGRPVRAEATVKGKKKESVIQCALEACRILDRLGLLRQANHEARKKKTRNWEEEDYYDSDEDNFLDRTGTVEKKREQRMRQAGKLETKVETYSSLLEKHAEVLKQISHIEKCIEDSRQTKSNSQMGSDDEDALDAFMSTLNKPMLNKSDIRKMKVELQNLHKEEERLKDLVNLARPANLPPLTTNPLIKKSTSGNSENANISVRQKGLTSSIGQRKKPVGNKSDKILPTHTTSLMSNETNKEEEEEEDSENDETINKTSDLKEERDNSQFKLSEAKDEKEKIETKNVSDQDKDSRETGKLERVKDIPDSNKKDSKESKVPNKRNLGASISTAQGTKKMKKEKSEASKKSGLDMYRDDYSTWLPPQDQTGDGKTSLNAKYGY